MQYKTSFVFRFLPVLPVELEALAVGGTFLLSLRSFLSASQGCFGASTTSRSMVREGVSGLVGVLLELLFVLLSSPSRMSSLVQFAFGSDRLTLMADNVDCSMLHNWLMTSISASAKLFASPLYTKLKKWVISDLSTSCKNVSTNSDGFPGRYPK